MIRRLALAAAAVLALTGCGDDQAPTAQAAPPAASPSAEPTTPTAPSPTEPPVHALGTTIRLAEVSVTAYAYKPTDLGRGDRGGSVEVRTCNLTSKAFPVSSGPWSLLFPDDTVSTETWSGVLQPQYPWGDGRQLRPGKCVRGWITFGLPGKRKPAVVEYAPRNDDGSTLTTVSWRI